MFRSVGKKSALHSKNLIVGTTSRMSFFSNNELIDHLKAKNIVKTPRVEEVLRNTDRLLYCGEYFDSPHSIGHNQTISAPHMHAMCLEIMNSFIKEGSKVMDVGSGSGYLTACLAHLVGDSGKVIGLETVKELVRAGQANVYKDCPDLLESGRIVIKHGNGWQGDTEESPFDAIHVGAAAVSVPQPLIDQLKEGGTLVIPVGPQQGEQYLMQITKHPNGETTSKRICAVRYVPLVNKET